jgi:2-haloacid dehalogenase
MDRRSLLGGSLVLLGAGFRMHGAVEVAHVRALTFDVFGTVVDWRSSIIREGTHLGQTKGIHADWAKFADAWRGGYGPAMSRVRQGELPWTNLMPCTG